MIDGISTIALNYVRPYEISIEISEDTLRRYGITLEQVAQVIRSTSMDMPGGTIKTKGGEILLRAKGQVYWGEEFEDIVVVTRTDGTKVMLSEIAEIRSGTISKKATCAPASTDTPPPWSKSGRSARKTLSRWRPT